MVVKWQFFIGVRPANKNPGSALKLSLFKIFVLQGIAYLSFGLERKTKFSHV